MTTKITPVSFHAGQLNLAELKDLNLLRQVESKSYRYPKSSLALADNALATDIVSQLAEISSKIQSKDWDFETARAQFDELLGLYSGNVVSFYRDFCAHEPQVWEATLATLFALASQARQNPDASLNLGENDDPDQDKLAGETELTAHENELSRELAMAQFLAPYVFVMDDKGEAYFAPKGKINFRLPTCTTTQGPESIYAALNAQIQNLVTGEFYAFTDDPKARDVQDDARYRAEASPSQSKSDAANPAGLAPPTRFIMPEDQTTIAKFFSDEQIPKGRYFPFWQIQTPPDDLSVIVTKPNAFTPEIASARVLVEKTYPATLTVADIYGETSVFQTELVVQNSINESPRPKIQGPSAADAGQVVSFVMKTHGDPNLDDKNFTLTWTLKLGKKVLQTGQGENFTFTAPNVDGKLRVILTVNDGHDNHATGTAELTLTVTPKPVTTSQIARENAWELSSVARAFKTEPTVVTNPTEMPNEVIAAITITEPDKPKFYDLAFPIDQSGSMDSKLATLVPEIRAVLAELKNQIEPGGEIRITLFTYGDSQTTIHLRTAWTRLGLPEDIDKLAASLEKKITEVATYIRTNGLHQETLWHSIWDVWEGGKKQSWGRPGEDCEVRFVALTDEEVYAQENVVNVPRRAKPFDAAEAEVFAAAHEMSLRIIQLKTSSVARHSTRSTKTYAEWLQIVRSFDATSTTMTHYNETLPDEYHTKEIEDLIAQKAKNASFAGLASILQWYRFCSDKTLAQKIIQEKADDTQFLNEMLEESDFDSQRYMEKNSQFQEALTVSGYLAPAIRDESIRKRLAKLRFSDSYIDPDRNAYTGIDVLVAMGPLDLEELDALPILSEILKKQHQLEDTLQIIANAEPLLEPNHKTIALLAGLLNSPPVGFKIEFTLPALAAFDIDPRKIPGLLEAIQYNSNWNSGSPPAIIAACQKNPRWIGVVLQEAKLAKDDNQYFNPWLQALAQLGPLALQDPNTLPMVLSEATKRPDNNFFWTVLGTLGETAAHDPRTIQVLTENLFPQGRPKGALHALQAFYPWLKHDPTVLSAAKTAFLNHATSTSDWLQFFSVYGPSYAGDPQILKKVLAFLDAGELNATHALAALAPTHVRTLPALQALLTNSSVNSGNKRLAAIAVARIAPESADIPLVVAPLMDYLVTYDEESNDPQITACLAALKTLYAKADPKKVEAAVLPYLKDKKPELRRAAVLVATELKISAARTELEAIAAKDYGKIYHAAERALQVIPAE